MTRAIWITWERQRRSIELAKALDVPCYVLSFSGPYIVRGLVLAVKTVVLLASIRPEVVFVQNPSMLAAAIVCMLRRLLGYKAVVDRHTNFRFDSLDSINPKFIGYHWLSKYTTRSADLTVVTNLYLKQVVEAWGGRGFVLQDKIPDLSGSRVERLKGKYNAVFICSYAADEPIQEVVSAAKLIDSKICVYITGNYKKANKSLLQEIPDNVILTGFLSEPDFEALIQSVDFALALTTKEHTLLCGAYEAVAALKPVIISDREALKAYFCEGVIVTDNDRKSIADAIMFAVRNLDALRGEVVSLKGKLQAGWHLRFQDLRKTVGLGLAGCGNTSGC